MQTNKPTKESLHNLFPGHIFYMLDIETDGLSPIKNSITSLCLTKFSSRTFKREESLQLMFLDKLPSREVDCVTLQWREINAVDAMEKQILKHVNIAAGLHSITDFVNRTSGALFPLLFCNHPEFDSAFLKGYFDEFREIYPFTHRNILDINSILTGIGYRPTDIYSFELDDARWFKIDADFQARNISAHAAEYDCAKQIHLLKCAFENN